MAALGVDQHHLIDSLRTHGRLSLLRDSANVLPTASLTIVQPYSANGGCSALCAERIGTLATAARACPASGAASFARAMQSRAIVCATPFQRVACYSHGHAGDTSAARSSLRGVMRPLTSLMFSTRCAAPSAIERLLSAHRRCDRSVLASRELVSRGAMLAASIAKLLIGRAHGLIFEAFLIGGIFT
jgi:hypothetical protein